MTLTPKQKNIFDYIKNFIADKGFAPCYREIKDHFGFASLASVNKHINTLKTKGVITFSEGQSRSITIVDDDKPYVTGGVDIVFMGYVSDDNGIEMLSDSHTIAMPKALVPHPDISYAIGVKGSFLLDENICNDDVIIVETSSLPDTGQKVLAKSIEYNTIIRYYYPEDDIVRFKSSSPSTADIVTYEHETTIFGIVVSLFRVM